MTRLFVQIFLGILGAFILSTFVSVYVIGRMMDREMADSNLEWMGGMPEDIRHTLNAVPPEDWPATIERLRHRIPDRIEVVEIAAVADEKARERLRSGRNAAAADGRKRVAYVPLADGVHAVSLSPPRRPGPAKAGHFLLSIAITMPIGGVIGFLLAAPVVRRLKVLEQAAMRIADGDLDARASLRSADAVGSLARQFNEMANKIQSLLESQRHLLQAVSHELRTPISRIGFALEMLNTESDPAARQSRIAAISGDLGELEELIAELQLYGRLDVENPYTHTDTVPVAARIAAIVRQFSEPDPGKEIHVETAGDEVRVVANPRYFDRVLQNLLRNAVRHATKAVTVSVAAADGSVAIEVADDGPGIAPDDRERVFEPFTRLDDSRSRESGGAGLGLAIVRRIVTSYGGTIAILDREGGGARFVVRWPTV